MIPGILEDYLIINKPLRRADVIVVMAGETKIRLPAAAELYKRGVADKILLTNDGIFSSWSEEKQRNLYEVEWAEIYLLKMGIPAKAVIKLPYTSSGSIYDALNTRKFILSSGLKSLLIVTSDYHTRRSLWIFERLLKGHPIKIGVYPANTHMESRSIFNRFVTLGYELIKYFYYLVRYTP
jgi:uncharacterized SAM-binding protein YcdF (DUF218 family)